ncbi:MAG: outer membrane lipoprotein-sorting protein [Gammaproteobacteria bacterium]|nr:outer membrane lipoprotein-sorting protein [Gammaproteobacteria bacterium]
MTGLLLPGQADADERGRALAQKVYERPDGDEVASHGSMVLSESGHEPRIRELYSFRREESDGEVSNLIRFTAPADIEGTGLLTIDHADGSTDQWIYLPALKRDRRIPSARRGGRFVGSDLFYEDLQDRKVEEDRHQWLRKESLEGVTTEVLESVPIDANSSVYGRRVSWIHPKTLIPMRVDLYRPGESVPFKRLRVYKVERIQGFWTVTDSVMKDLESGHQTRILNEKTVYDRRLPAHLFTNRALQDPSIDQRFRP